LYWHLVSETYCVRISILPPCTRNDCPTKSRSRVLGCCIIDTTCLKHTPPPTVALRLYVPRQEYFDSRTRKKAKESERSSPSVIVPTLWPCSKRSPRKKAQTIPRTCTCTTPTIPPHIPCAAHPQHIITTNSPPHVQPIPPQISRSSQGEEAAESGRPDRVVARAWSCESRYVVYEVGCQWPEEGLRPVPPFSWWD